MNVNFKTTTFVLKLLSFWTSILYLFKGKQNEKGRESYTTSLAARTITAKQQLAGQVRATALWSSLGGWSCSLLPVLRHLLPVRDAAPPGLWGGWAAITVAITTRNGAETTQVCPWTQLFWGIVEKGTFTTSVRFWQSSVRQSVWRKALRSRWLRKRKSTSEVTNSTWTWWRSCVMPSSICFLRFLKNLSQPLCHCP